MEKPCIEPTFLALTAMADYWDLSQPILFLGPWCYGYQLDAPCDNAALFEHPALVDKNPDAAYHVSIEMYEKLIPILARNLNEIHQLDKSLEYWQKVIGPFLLIYIQVLYNRWTAIRLALSSYSNLSTIGMANSSYITPINSSEFVQFASDSDAWNQQLMTQILEAMSFEIEAYKDYAWDSELAQRQAQFGQPSFFRVRTKLFRTLCHQLARLRKFNVAGLCFEGGGLMARSYLPTVLRLSKARILPLIEYRPTERAALKLQTLNMKMRERLIDGFPKTAFYTVLSRTLKHNFPVSFIEQYRDEFEKSQHAFSYEPKVVLGGGILNDRFAMWRAQMMEKGKTCISVQHGGAYGILDLITYEQLEKTQSSRFISWGWCDSHDTVVPATSVSACNVKRMLDACHQGKASSTMILWPTTDVMRYTVHLTSISLSAKAYIDWQERFLSHVAPHVKTKVTMRLRPGSKYKPYIQTRFKTLNVVCDDRGSFYTQLGRSTIVICDNINTTMLYALSANIPTIMFWDQDACKVRQDVMPYMHALQDVGIYHKTPESAAQQLNEVFDDPQRWWNNPQLQAAREAFCEQYARISPDCLSEWTKLLVDYIDTHSTL